MNSSKEDQKFVAKTLGALSLEVAKATATFCFHEITQEEYLQVTEEQLTKHFRLLLEWKNSKVDTNSKKYSWSYYDEDTAYWYHNVAYFQPTPYYDTREQAEQAANQFLRDNPNCTRVKIEEYDL